MTDIPMAKINTTIEIYTQNIRPFLSGVLNNVHGIEHLDKTTLTDLLEQASNHTIVFQQNFEVNYYTLLKFSPFTLNSTLTMTNPLKDYEWYLNFVGLTFAFALVLDIDQDDYPVLRNLMSPLRDSVEKLASCYNNLQHFLVLTQPSTTGTITTQIETEDHATQTIPHPHLVTLPAILWHTLTLNMTLNMTLDLNQKIKTFWQLNKLIPLITP